MDLQSEPGAKRSTSIFRAREGRMLTREVMPVGSMRAADKAGLAVAVEAGLQDSAFIRILFDDEASGVNLTYAWFKPRATLPRHSHSADCLYYIVSGSLQFGAERLGPADGLLIPAGTLYSYEAGPEGVEVLEFRTMTHFDISYSGSAASWARLTEGLKLNRQQWDHLPLPVAARRMLGSED